MILMMRCYTTILAVVTTLCLMIVSDAFVIYPTAPRTASRQLAAEKDGKEGGGGGLFQGISNFFQEIDNFMDDASARRLGNGAAFYGKRKSKFYGEQDKNRKSDPGQADPTEDFQAPMTGGYFKWMPDENGQMRPVTRMKNKVVERNPNFWDRVYEKDKKQKD